MKENNGDSKELTLKTQELIGQLSMQVLEQQIIIRNLKNENLRLLTAIKNNTSKINQSKESENAIVNISK